MLDKKITLKCARIGVLLGGAHTTHNLNSIVVMCDSRHPLFTSSLRPFPLSRIFPISSSSCHLLSPPLTARCDYRPFSDTFISLSLSYAHSRIHVLLFIVPIRSGCWRSTWRFALYPLRLERVLLLLC